MNAKTMGHYFEILWSWWTADFVFTSLTTDKNSNLETSKQRNGILGFPIHEIAITRADVTYETRLVLFSAFRYLGVGVYCACQHQFTRLFNETVILRPNHISKPNFLLRKNKKTKTHTLSLTPLLFGCEKRSVFMPCTHECATYHLLLYYKPARSYSTVCSRVTRVRGTVLGGPVPMTKARM